MLAVVVSTATVTLAQDATVSSYRVAGTIKIDETRAVAMIESSAGTQQLYRLGDHIDDWEIVGIDLEGVAVRRNGQFARLPLEGKLAPLAAQVRDVPETLATTVANTSLDFKRALQDLQTLELKRNTKDDPLTYADVNKALGLAAATRIHQIDGENADTPTAVMQLSMPALAREGAMRLNVTDNSVDVIYLLPRAP